MKREVTHHHSTVNRDTRYTSTAFLTESSPAKLGTQAESGMISPALEAHLQTMNEKSKRDADVYNKHNNNQAISKNLVRSS